MPLTDDDILRILARLTVLEHVVSSTFRDQATAEGKTANEVAQYAEAVKKFFEQNIPPGLTEMHVSAAVDRLFQQIVADIKSQGSP